MFSNQWTVKDFCPKGSKASGKLVVTT